MNIDDELGKIIDLDLNKVLKGMLDSKILKQEQYDELMKKDRDTKEVVAYLGYLDMKREASKQDSKMEGLSPMSKKVVASMKKELKRIKSKDYNKVKHIPKISTQKNFMELMEVNNLQKQLDEAFAD